MSERFVAIPVRAFTDKRLSAADFRLLGAIAYHDRLGRNHMGRFVDPRKSAEESSINYSHVARQAKRLVAFGYLIIGRSRTDRRKHIYSLIYNEDPAVVANDGDETRSGTTSAAPGWTSTTARVDIHDTDANVCLWLEPADTGGRKDGRL